MGTGCERCGNTSDRCPQSDTAGPNLCTDCLAIEYARGPVARKPSGRQSSRKPGADGRSLDAAPEFAPAGWD